MQQTKYLFIDRDGTLIKEPKDEQVDSIDKLEFMPGVFTALEKLSQAGFTFVMVTNQDGLGTASFKQADFDAPQDLMLKTFESQGIVFDDIKICPHLPEVRCDCRKPKVGLLLDYLRGQSIDNQNSYVIGDRQSDAELAENMGIQFIRMTNDWSSISAQILDKPRTAYVTRKTNETDVQCRVNLDACGEIKVATGIEFYNHMLEQVAKQAGMNLTLIAKGDTHIDDHHTVEDVAIVFGEAMRQALGDKIGIARFGFLLPMDESLAQIAIDLSGRPSCQFQAEFKREKVGEFSTELVAHFFTSFSDALRAAIHVEVKGENTHHMIEAAFKSLGRALRQAMKKESTELASTKGAL